MAKGEQRHVRRRPIRWVPEALVVLLLVVAAVQVQFDVAAQLGWRITPDRTTPAEVPPPPGLQLAAQPAAAPVAQRSRTASLRPARVRAAVNHLAHADALGGHVAVVVAGEHGPPAYRHGGGPMTPASTMKLLTTTAALQSLGPTARFHTDVRLARGHGRVRSIVLVGGGDPFLASTAKAARAQYAHRATTAELAARTARALHRRGIERVRLSYDATLFSGPAVNPTWPDTYISTGVVPPISALWVDEGHDADGYGYASDPAATAADLFARQLTAHHVHVVGSPRAHRAPPRASRIARVLSAPVGEIVQRVLDVSDNKGAEVLARQVGLAEGRAGSFKGGTAAVVAVLHRLGIATPGLRMFDGSGLSRKDRLEPGTLIDVLRTAASSAHPNLREVITGLPVAGFTGSLASRYVQGAPAGRGRVRAKTGTLTGVDNLAGVATDRTGTLVFFAVIADQVKESDTLQARAVLDRLTAALGACRCGAAS